MKQSKKWIYRRLKRSRRKNNKKKSLTDFGLKVGKVKKKNNKVVSYSSLSSSDIRNRNILNWRRVKFQIRSLVFLMVNLEDGASFPVVF